MEHQKILSSGEKIKLLRKKYNLRQDDISGSDVTRNLISEIENNKANLSKSTAEIILKNLNKALKIRRIVASETVEYLLEDEEAQARKILDNYIKELENVMVFRDNGFIETLEEAEAFLMKWDIKEKKIAIYELAGDYFCNKNEMSRSSIYYDRALTLIEKNSSSKRLLFILRKLSMVYVYSGKLNESIECCNLALKHFPNMSKDYRCIFMHNSAVGYSQLGNYQKALENYNEVEKNIKKTDIVKRFKVMNNKAICLNNLEYYDEAIKTYNGILEFLGERDEDKRLIIYINIVNVYMKLDKVEEVTRRLKTVVSQVSNAINSEYEGSIYLEIGLIYKYLRKSDKASVYYNKALEYAKKRKDNILVKKALRALIDVYAELSDNKKATELLFAIKENLC